MVTNTKNNNESDNNKKKKESKKPIGDEGHRVSQGDCVIHLAWSGRERYDWEKIWNHPNNSKLKDERGDPNLLLRGDKVYIPPLEKEWDNAADQKKHRYKCKKRHTILRVRCRQFGEPIANEPYKLEIDDDVYEGETNDDGEIEEKIPVTAIAGKLRVGEDGDEALEYDIRIGSLDPIDTIQGVTERLNNLGYAAGRVKEDPTKELRRAILRFQHDHGLDLTGEDDDETRDKLEDVYGS